MNIRPRPSHCLVSPDPDFERSKGGIIYPAGLQGKAKTGFVHLHNVSQTWDEVDLTGRRVVFDRWSSRPFRLNVEGKEYEFGSVSQWAILGVFEEQIRYEFIDACGAQQAAINEQVKERNVPIDKPFAYHKPSEMGLVKINGLREAYSVLKTLLEETCPPSRQLSVALTELETSAMWAIKSVVFNDPESEVS